MAGSATPAAAMRRVPTILRETFGLSRLRPGQPGIIERVLAGQPTLAVMPTGAAKSLCYPLPALTWTARRWGAWCSMRFADRSRRSFLPKYVQRAKPARRAPRQGLCV